MVVDVAKVAGNEDVFVSQTGGDGEATCEVGSSPLLAMPSDRATVVGLGWREGNAGTGAGRT